MIKKHPLIETLIKLRGNAKACVYTEPLWMIPNSLYLPFVSVYMSALMLTDSQIGLVASVSLFFRAIVAGLSGAITDKVGRKKATFIFDVLAWSIPCLLWALSQNFWWFVIAAAFNGLMEVPNVSWTCLLVEDADRSAMVRIYTLIHIIGQMAVIFAPIAAIMISLYSIVPVMRVLYLFAFASKTIKFVLLYIYSTETIVGKVRKEETVGISLFKVMSGYGEVFKRIFASPGMIFALTMSAIFTITSMIMHNFFGLLITGDLNIPDYFLAYYPILRSIIIILFMFIILPRLSKHGFKIPMLAGVVLYILSHVVLIISPPGNLFVPFIYVLIEACAFCLVIPRRDSIVALLIEDDERARISSIFNSLVLFVSIPFGYLAGWLSDIDRRLPFGLDILLFIVAFIVICFGGKYMRQSEA